MTKPIYRKKMEEKLGRELRPYEIVHHKDGNQHNNDINNLELITRKNHITKEHLTSRDWDSIINEMLVNNIKVTASDINEAMGLFFPARQREIILRKIYKLELSKTEREYYSRVIKKKLQALANPLLQQMAMLIIAR